jgi:hypothetical protein
MGYEANGTRPTLLIASCCVPPSQGRCPMVSHPSNPFDRCPQRPYYRFYYHRLRIVVDNCDRLRVTKNDLACWEPYGDRRQGKPDHAALRAASLLTSGRACQTHPRKPRGTSRMEVSGTPHPTANRSQAAHGNHGRRVEYSIGWPVDEQTLAGIEQLRESDWGPAVHADGDVHLAAQVADLTGIMRTARCPRAGRGPQAVPEPHRSPQSRIRHSAQRRGRPSELVAVLLVPGRAMACRVR